MSRLSLILCLLLVTSAVFAQQEGSGDDDVTRPRPSDETTTPRTESTDCKCFLTSGKKSYKLHHLLGDVPEEVEMEYVDSDEGCDAARSKCANHCAGVGSGLLKSGYSAELTGNKYTGYPLGNLLCFGASSEDPMTVEITSRLRCRGGASHHKRYDEYMASYRSSTPLCCGKGAKAHFTPVDCSAAETDLGSGDEGVRPRPDEELAGSGDDGVRPRPDDELAGEDDVTRPRPEEEITEPATPKPTTEMPRNESTECKCFVASGKKSYMLHKLMRDAPEEVEMQYIDSDEGCADARNECAKHCASVGSGLFTSGYSAKLSGGRFKRYSLGDQLCSGARSEDPITVEITSRLRCRVGTSRHAKQDGYKTAYASSEPLCCARKNRGRFSAVSCPAA